MFLELWDGHHGVSCLSLEGFLIITDGGLDFFVVIGWKGKGGNIADISGVQWKFEGPNRGSLTRDVGSRYRILGNALAPGDCCGVQVQILP